MINAGKERNWSQTLRRPAGINSSFPDRPRLLLRRLGAAVIVMPVPALRGDDRGRLGASSWVVMTHERDLLMAEPKTDTLPVPGAVLHYDVRTAGSGTDPVLLIIGSPMGAAGFVTLAGHFADRTVVTYDPRGSGRSQRTDGALET